MNVTMFGLLSGLGVVMAGFGMFKGGSKVGEAAESSADHVGRALDSISNDVKELKTYFIREFGPNVTATLVRFQQVLGRADELIITWTFATKCVALLASLRRWCVKKSHQRIQIDDGEETAQFLSHWRSSFYNSFTGRSCLRC